MKNQYFIFLFGFFYFGKTIDKNCDMWYNVHATQTEYFFSQIGKYLGKRCFLYQSFLFVKDVCVAAYEGIHFFVRPSGRIFNI